MGLTGTVIAMGKQVNQTELAEIVGVTDVTLWQWQKDGMPVLERNLRGQSNKYDTAEVVVWMIQREVKKVREESPRDMLYREQTKLVQLQIAEKERALVPAAEIEPLYARLVMAARQRLLLVPHLPDLDLNHSQSALLEVEVDKALTELSQYEPSAGADQDSGSVLGSAIEDDDRPVGEGEKVSERKELGVPGKV